MGKNFDRIFIFWIDRVVWFILMAVMSNLAVEITGYAVGIQSANLASTNGSQEEPPSDAANQVYFWPNRQVETIPQQIETVKTTKQPPTILIHKGPGPSSQTIFGSGLNGGGNGDDEGSGDSERMTLWDSIFNIPISTLKAVNTLVQVIAGSIQLPGKVIQSRYQQQQQQQATYFKSLTKENGNFSVLAA